MTIRERPIKNYEIDGLGLVRPGGVRSSRGQEIGIQTSKWERV